MRAFRGGILVAVLAAVAATIPGSAAAAVSVTYTITSGTPGDNGWYLTDVKTTISESPDTKNTTCPGVRTFTSSADTLDCTATDGVATVSFHLQFKIDKDKPTVTGAAADHQANANGWYNGPVTVAFSGSDATSGIASCDQVTYNGPDTGSGGVSGTCRDVAGNVSAPFSFALKYDATPPTVTPAPARGPDANGWYNHAVGVAFSGSDATSGIDSCTSGSYGGPDSAGATVSGTCSDKAGNSGSASFSVQYDATPPRATATLKRPPDADGWYNRPVALHVAAADATAGLDHCTRASYSGPDSDSATLATTCRDKAGNTATDSVSFKYDSTPPKLSDVTVTTGNRTVTLRWAAPGYSLAVLLRTTKRKGSGGTRVYRGRGHTFTDTKLKNGVRYRYTLSVVDAAGNVAKAGALVMPLALLRPRPGQRVRVPPLLRWAPLPGATYYNVQVFFGGRKVLSVWPLSTSLKLTRTWTYAEKKHRLTRGRYRWYVWPGYGPRKASKYGKLLGGSFFLVR